MDNNLLSRSHYENLALAGAFNSVNSNRKQTFMSAQVLVDLSIASSGDKHNQQENIFGDSINLNEIWKLPNIDDWNEKEKLEKERNSLGFYYSGHPLNYSKSILDELGINDISKINLNTDAIVDIAGVVVQVNERSSRNGRFARVVISSIKSLEEVIIYSDIYNEKKELLVPGNELYLKINVMKEDNGANRLLVRDLWLLESRLNKLISSFEINLNDNCKINNFIRDLKLNMTSDNKSRKYPLHIIFNDQDSNIVTIETIQNLSSPFSFKERLENSDEVLSVRAVIKT